MVSKVTIRGQTTIPSRVRRVLGISPGCKLDWSVENGQVKVIPIPKDPITVLRGCLKGKGSVVEFLQWRAQEREREYREEKNTLARPHKGR